MLIIFIAFIGMAVAAGDSWAQGIGLGAPGSNPSCTHATLHAGTCQQAVAGYFATLTDGGSEADPCLAASAGGGSNLRTCRYSGSDWAVIGEGGPGGSVTPNAEPGADHSAYVAAHADGANAAAAQAITGVDAAGAAQGAFDVQTQAEADAHAALPNAHHVPTVDTNTNGAIPVSSFAEIESVMRAHDQPVPSGFLQAADSISVAITLADDFSYDRTSTTPHRINLPTGGGEHPRISIYFNGQHIAANAIDSLEIYFGRYDGAGADLSCTTGSPGVAPGFFRYEANCMGVAHDYEVYLYDLNVANVYTGCDGTPTAPCGRAAISFVDSDRLWDQSGEGASYGGRVHLINAKLGQAMDWASVTAYPQLDRPNDVCVRTVPGFSHLELAGGQFDCESMLEFNPGALTSAQPHVSFKDPRWASIGITTPGASSCSRCAGGVIRANTAMTSAVFSGTLWGTGPLGNFRGGSFNLDYRANFPGASSGDCWSVNQHATESYFIDNGTVANPLRGFVRVTGEMCTRGWVRADAADGFVTDAILNGALPGFLATNTQVGADRIPVFDATSSANIDNITAKFHLDIRPDTTDITYSQLMDSDLVSGVGLRNDQSYARVDLGIDGLYQVVGSNPSPVIHNSKGDRKFTNNKRVRLLSAGTYDLEPIEVDGSQYQFQGASTFNLPPVPATNPAEGWNACFEAVAGATVVINPDDADQIFWSTGLLDAGESISNSSAALMDKICVTQFDLIGWTVNDREAVGTWVEENP